MCTTVISKLGGDKLSGIDILINCAGLIYDGDTEFTFPQDYDYLMDVNLRAVFHITQIFIPFLEKAKGCVVNVSSLVNTYCSFPTGHRRDASAIA